jgi:hypothetical protein
MRHLMRIISKEFGLLIVEVKSEVNNFKICFKKETPPVQKLGMGLTIIRGFSLKLKLLILTSVVILLSIVSSSWNSEIPSKKATFTSPKKDVSTSSNVSTQPSKRQIIPLTEKRCKSLNSANGISTITAEYVAKKAGVSLRSVSLWKARYSKQIGGVCYFTFDTPKGPKTCWSSTAKSENEKVAYFMGAPNIPVLVQDPGKTPFLVVGHCNDFRPKTRN